ncbi:MAG: site-specific integrase [Firmicutes bacterium]|nr:site-specific integrase [Bacillota bacterium]
MASITKRGDSYRIRVSNGFDSSGKRQYATTTWTPPETMTEKQIQKELQRKAVLFEEDVQTGQYINSTIKFADFAALWLTDYAEKQLKQKTVDRYKTLLPRINRHIGAIRLDKLAPKHIIDFLNALDEDSREDIKYIAAANLSDHLKKRGLTRAQLAEKAEISKSTLYLALSGEHVSAQTAEKISKVLDLKRAFNPASPKKELSDQTKRHYFRLISSILTTAKYWQVVPENICSRVKAPKVEHKEARYYDEQEVSKLLSYLKDAPKQYEVMVTLVLYSGFRRGELLGLKWADIDFNESLITINQTLLYSKERGLYFDTPKSASSQRTIKISASMMELLHRHKAWQAQQRLQAGDQWVDNGLLFTLWNGQPVRPDTFSDWFTKFIKKTDLPHISLHSLRHTCATLQIMGGLPVKTVSSRLGHARETTTRDIYSHAIQSLDAKAADVLEDILNPAAQKI